MGVDAERDTVVDSSVVRVPGWDTAVAMPRKPVVDALRRGLDVVVAAVLIVLTAPIVLVAAVAVRLTSAGPAFFWQDRYGRNESTFRVVKLRTMVVDQGAVIDLAEVEAAERDGVLTKTDDDPRVTRIGRVLRRTSIDELPQLWNVLRGDMALVGPRPLLPFMLDPYPALRRSRCVVRPGVTGLWQISRREDNTSALSMAAEDLDYVATRTVGGDVRIMVATVPAILRGTGAV
jgi:exopolysaccharide production protein ExoY